MIVVRMLVDLEVAVFEPEYVQDIAKLKLSLRPVPDCVLTENGGAILSEVRKVKTLNVREIT
jgi:hypothetical protein